MLPTFITTSDLWGFVAAASIVIVFFLLAGIFNFLTLSISRKWQNTNPTSLSANILICLKGPISLFLVLTGLFSAILIVTELDRVQVHLGNNFSEWINKIWLVTLISQISYLAYHILDALLTWYITNMAEKTDTHVDDRLLPPLRRLLPLFVYSLGTLMAMSALNIPISPIWAGLGIGGIAVALAVQPTLANFFAGTYVVTEGELNMGDYIELSGGPSGYVVEVGWRSTKIRTMFNNLVIIPNSRMAESIVTNYYSPTPAMNVMVYCGVSYDSNLRQVEKIVMDASTKLVKESPHAIKNVEPWVGFEEFGDSNITFWVFIQAVDRLGSFTLTSDLVKIIHERLNEEGVEINYPVRKLIMSEPQKDLPATLTS